MITVLAHAGVKHSTEVEAAAHNNLLLLLVLSGATIITGLIIFWLLNRTNDVNTEEED